MTGLGEPVYVEENDAVAEMVENIAAIIAGCTATALQPNMGGIWAAVTPGHKRKSFDAAQCVLESLGIPLTVLAALKSGEWVALPKAPNTSILDAGDEWSRDGWSADAYDAMISAAPKEP